MKVPLTLCRGSFLRPLWPIKLLLLIRILISLLPPVICSGSFRIVSSSSGLGAPVSCSLLSKLASVNVGGRLVLIFLCVCDVFSGADGVG